MRVNYEIYAEVEDDETEETKTVRLALEQEDGTVFVVAVDEDGEAIKSGRLIVFLSDGSMARPFCVNPVIDVQLDAQSRIADGSLG